MVEGVALPKGSGAVWAHRRVSCNSHNPFRRQGPLSPPSHGGGNRGSERSGSWPKVAQLRFQICKVQLIPVLALGL